MCQVKQWQIKIEKIGNLQGIDIKLFIAKSRKLLLLYGG